MVLRARDATAARKAITSIAIAAGFASTLAYPLVYWINQAAGWRVAVLVMAGIAAFVAVPALRLAARKLEAEAVFRKPPENPEQRQWRGLLALPGFAWLMLAFALIALIPGTLLAHLFPLMDDRGVAPETAVFAAALIGPAQVAGRVLITSLAPKTRAGRITLGAMLMLVLAAALMGATAYVSGLVFAAVLAFGIGNGLVGIFRPVLAGERYGERDIGAVAGALAAPAIFVAALSPLLGAYVAAWGGYNAVLVMVGAAGLLAAALLVLSEPAGGLSLRWPQAARRCQWRMRRGFSASGTSRTRSICSIPFSCSRAAHADMVGQLESLSKARLAMPRCR